MAQSILYALLVFLVIEFLFSSYLSYINHQTWKLDIPSELSEMYDAATHQKARDYANENYRVGLISGTLSLFITLAMLWFYGFAMIDSLASHFTTNYMLQGLLFWAVIGVGSMLISLPFELYSTFVIEEKYGFNKTTPRLFVLDKIKGLLLGAIIGGGLYALLAYLYTNLGDNFWWMAWMVVSGFSIIMAMFYTSLLLPLFNKLSPLEAGDLRTEIESYASKVAFPLTNVMVMDGSKRSAKANAFFSGLGNKKSVVLFDTLIEQLNQQEIMAVLAHEVGHYKKRHILQSMFISVVQTGLLFFVFGLLAQSDWMAGVLGVGENKLHLSLITFGLLFSPISMLTGILFNLLSRKNEYEADAYAKNTYDGEPLISGLKKMTVNHLSNPQPHPWYIFVHYSHPTLLQRIRGLRG
jgi:STE24 endopeptidase